MSTVSPAALAKVREGLGRGAPVERFVETPEPSNKNSGIFAGSGGPRSFIASVICGVNVDVEHGRHVCFGMRVECQMDDEVSPVSKRVGFVVIVRREPEPLVVVNRPFYVEN